MDNILFILINFLFVCLLYFLIFFIFLFKVSFLTSSAWGCENSGNDYLLNNNEWDNPFFPH